MPFEEHDTLTGAQIPDASERVHPSGRGKRAVRLKGHAVDRFWVTFLMQHFRQLMSLASRKTETVKTDYASN